jgi:hypothetical protein
MNLYYEVMHKMEFEHFVTGHIKAKTKSHRKDLLKELREFLILETNQEWHLSLEIHSHIESIFEQLIHKLKKSEDWKIVTKYFPEAEIKDVYAK